MGIENACQICHRDRTPQALQAQVTAWYGEIKPHAAAVARVFAADSAGDAASAARLALSGSDGHAMAEFAGLARVMGRYASSDLSTLDGESIDRLEALAQGGDPDLQALALATLHSARGADPQVRRFLAKQLRRLGARDGQVRDRWAWILRVRADAALSSGDYEGAIGVYRRAQEVTPEDATLSRSLGIAYTRLRDYPAAVEHFRRSLALRPKDPQVLVELGFATMQRGALDSAIAAYRQAIAINPWEPGAYANLGVAYLRGGSVGAAVEALQTAVELDPGLSAAHFALASAYAQLGERTRAIAAVERGLEFDPRNTAAHRMLEALHAP